MPGRRDHPPLTLAMTPMIDVVFLLLIFFVCTASFTPLESSLPTSTAATREAARSLDSTEEAVIIIRGQLAAGSPVWQLSGEFFQSPAEMGRVLKRLADDAPESRVIFDIASDILLGDVVDVYDHVYQSGLSRIEFVTQQKHAK